MLPQRQTTSSCPASRTWPMSPAAPWAPRWMRRSVTIPQPMPVPIFTYSRCSHVAPVRPVLAQRHDVHVVVDEHRRVVVAREPARDREAVPARHHRRRDRLAARERHRRRARRCRSRARRRRARPTTASSSSKRSWTHASTISGSRATSVSYARSASGAPARSRHRQPRVRRAEVGHQHDAGAAVEGQHGRRPPAGRGAAAGLVDELVREQRLDPLRHGRAGQPGAPREVRARDRLAVADQAQDAPGPGRARWGRGSLRRSACERVNQTSRLESTEVSVRSTRIVGSSRPN